MLHLSRYLHLACELLFFLFCFVLFSRSMTLKLGWEISERGERKQRREKKNTSWKRQGMTETSRNWNTSFKNIQKKKKKKTNASPFLLSWEHGECWHLEEVSQHPKSLYEMWCDGTITEQVCIRTAGKYYILEDDVLMQQKSTRALHWF